MPPTEETIEKANKLTSLILQFIDRMQNSPTNALVIVLICLMGVDILTGLIAASISKEVDSSYSYRGMLKKAQMLLMVAAAMMFEFIYPDIPWSKIIASFICLTEIISITENIGKSGVPLPKQLKDTLKRLREDKSETTRLEVKVDAHNAKEVTIESTKRGDSKVSISDPVPVGETTTTTTNTNSNGEVTTTKTTTSQAPTVTTSKIDMEQGR